LIGNKLLIESAKKPLNQQLSPRFPTLKLLYLIFIAGSGKGLRKSVRNDSETLFFINNKNSEFFAFPIKKIVNFSVFCDKT